MCISLSRKKTQQRFNASADKIFTRLLEVLPNNKIKIKNSDRNLGRILAKKGASMFSWGETIEIVIEDISPESCTIHIESAAKMGYVFQFVHRKNIETILKAI